MENKKQIIFLVTSQASYMYKLTGNMLGSVYLSNKKNDKQNSLRLNVHAYLISPQTKTPIEMGDCYYRPKLNMVFKGSGWAESDFKVLKTSEKGLDIPEFTREELEDIVKDTYELETAEEDFWDREEILESIEKAMEDGLSLAEFRDSWK